MKKVYLSALVVFGFMNFCFGQINTNIERISVRTYDTNGLVEHFFLQGDEAVSFDIPTYIKENEDFERVLITGTIRSNFSTTNIKFDSNKDENLDAEYICKEVQTVSNPFLGVWGTGQRDYTGVYVKEVIPSTSADKAGIIASAIITEFNGDMISSFCDLKSSVMLSDIGDRVELKLLDGTNEYSKYVVLGSREVNTVSYKYCHEEQTEVVEENKLNRSLESASLTTYPNPTISTAHVNFISTSDEDLVFSVLDITGNLIHKEIYGNFDGELSLDYNFENASAGTYIITILQGKEMYKRKVQLIKQ